MEKKAINNLLEFLDDNEELTIRLTKDGTCTIKSSLEYIDGPMEKLLQLKLLHLVKAVIGIPALLDVSVSIPGVDVDRETLTLLTEAYEYGLGGLAPEPGEYKWSEDRLEYLYDETREDEDGNYNPTEEEENIQYVLDKIIPFAREWSFWYAGCWHDPVNFKFLGYCYGDTTMRNITETLECNYEIAMRFFTKYKGRVFTNAEEIQKAFNKVDY